MYLGLIKRGLAAMCAFFLLIYLAITAFALPLTLLFSLSIPVLWLTSLFDGFHTRRRINAGDPPEDNIRDILSALSRNKTLTLIPHLHIPTDPNPKLKASSKLIHKPWS
jgi:hypothetical protein